MRTVHLLPSIVLTLVALTVGCVEETSKDRVVNDLVSSQDQPHPDQAMYTGDKDGYHYIHLRDLYSYTGDHEYRVAASKWAIADTFPLTDDASQWQNVSWADRETLNKLKISYVLRDPREQVAAPSTNSMDINAPRPLSNDAASTPTISSATSDASAISQTAPTTQPASKP